MDRQKLGFSPPGTDQYHYRHKTRLYPFINHKEMYHSAKFYTLQKILLKRGAGRMGGHGHTHTQIHTPQRYTKKRLPPSNFPVANEIKTWPRNLSIRCPPIILSHNLVTEY